MSSGSIGANGDVPGASSAPTPSARHGRARHARTNASLTSSSRGTSIDAQLSTDRLPLPRRTSVPNEASRIFQATGFDPFGTEPDTLFRSLSVKEVEAYERAVRSTALGKQEELRALVGQRYEDLLGTANTIIDMAGSSSQLSQRLHELSDGVRSTALAEDRAESSKKTNRRKSFLPNQGLPAVPDVDSSSLQQEAIYVLGASLRLIMDAPEYVWKSIEKGKTLQAAWAFMLTRATWYDLIDASPQSGMQMALTSQSDEGISSASEAVSLLRVHVKKAFPFIEKQWQSMLPMRKQIVHRAVALLSHPDIESMAVVDQLAALMLIDGTKLDQASHLLFSQRLTAMRRILHQHKSHSSPHQRVGERRQSETGHENEAARSAAPESTEDRAARTSQTITQLVTLFARTLQHAVQIFLLPGKSGSARSSRPLLLDLMATITDPANFTPAPTASTSPTSERTFLLPHPASKAEELSTRQNAAAQRALRRRSSHGLPSADAVPETTMEATPERSHTEQSRPLRVSTVSIVQALPSARVLMRLLPPSLWNFVPFFDLEGHEVRAPEQVLAELSAWSTKARETMIGGSGNTAPDTVRAVLSQPFDVKELALVRRSLRLALQRVRRVVSRKLAGPDRVHDERRSGIVARVHSELQQLEQAIDSILQERLLHLVERKLQRAAEELLTNTAQMVSSLQAGSKSPVTRADAPLAALFHVIETDRASTLERGQWLTAEDNDSPTKASYTFAATLQDHVCGRSQQVDRLSSLYEAPLAAVTEEVQLYRAELAGDERFADASEDIRTKFDSILASSRAEVEKGLMDLLDQAQLSSDQAHTNAKPNIGVPISTSLVMRLIAVLAIASWTEQGGNKPELRRSVKAALERIWKPSVERRLSDMLKARVRSNTDPDGLEADSYPSSSMLCALATLSEAIVHLGPALSGPELAEQVRDVLEGMAKSGNLSVRDVEAVQTLLASDPASLSKHVAKDAGLHRIRLALSPLLLALAAGGPESQKDAGAVTTESVLTRAEPASAAGQVKPILAVSRKRLERFSPLPVR